MRWKQLNVEPKNTPCKRMIVAMTMRSYCCISTTNTMSSFQLLRVFVNYWHCYHNVPVVSIWNLIHLKTMNMQWFKCLQTTRIGYQGISRYRDTKNVSLNHGYCLLNSVKGNTCKRNVWWCLLLTRVRVRFFWMN